MFDGVAHSGVDSFTPDVGKFDSMECLACKATCDVERNVNGPTCFAAAMGRSKRLHDSFRCPNIGQDWHDQAVELYLAALDTPSPSIAAIIKKDLKAVVKSKRRLS